MLTKRLLYETGEEVASSAMPKGSVAYMVRLNIEKRRERLESARALRKSRFMEARLSSPTSASSLIQLRNSQAAEKSSPNALWGNVSGGLSSRSPAGNGNPFLGMLNQSTSPNGNPESRRGSFGNDWQNESLGIIFERKQLE